MAHRLLLGEIRTSLLPSVRRLLGGSRWQRAAEDADASAVPLRPRASSPGRSARAWADEPESATGITY